METRWLYRVAAVAAFAAVILFRPHLSAEVSLLRSLGLISFEPAPGGPLEWFALLQARPLLGLILLEVGDLVNYALVGLVFVALFSALGGARRASVLIAAAQALLTGCNPAGVHQGMGTCASLFLIHAAGIAASAAMLGSPEFGRAAAVTGLLANGLYLLYFPVLALAPAWVALPPSLSAPVRLLWYVLIAVRLLRLAADRPFAPRPARSG